MKLLHSMSSPFGVSLSTSNILIGTTTRQTRITFAPTTSATTSPNISVTMELIIVNDMFVKFTNTYNKNDNKCLQSNDNLIQIKYCQVIEFKSDNDDGFHLSSDHTFVSSSQQEITSLQQ